MATGQSVPSADLVIGAVRVHGARAPYVIRREQLALMKPGAVLVDVAIDQGGCFESSRPTTHGEATYEVDGISHYGVTNMPGAVPITSTYAIHNATLPYGTAPAEHAPPGRPVSHPPGVGGGRGTCWLGTRQRRSPRCDELGEPGEERWLNLELKLEVWDSPNSAGIVTDVCLPISRLAEGIAAVQADIEAAGLLAPMVGHVGDGNFHLIFLVDLADAEEVARAKAVKAQIAFYGSTPAYRPVLELHGWGELHDELHERSKRGEWEEMGTMIGDEVPSFGTVCACAAPIPKTTPTSAYAAAAGNHTYQVKLDQGQGI